MGPKAKAANCCDGCEMRWPGTAPVRRGWSEITHLIADSMGTEVCSVYLFRDAETLELCATEGLKPEAVHQTRMRMGEGLVGRVAKVGTVVNEADAPSAKGFRYMPETGEEIYSSFLGVPIQRLGEKLGVLVVQSKPAREFSADEVYALEVVAMVLAEMTELGAFVGEGAALSARHQQSVLIRGTSGQEGAAEGHVWLHEPRVVVTNPIAEDPHKELTRLHEAVDTLRISVDQMLAGASGGDTDQVQVLEAYRMFANSKGWMRRMEEDISRGLSAEAAVEKEQSAARSRLGQVHRRLSARPAARSGRSVEPVAAYPDRSGHRYRGGIARRSDPDRPQYRSGRTAGLRAFSERDRAGGRLCREPRRHRGAGLGNSLGHPCGTDHHRSAQWQPYHGRWRSGHRASAPRRYRRRRFP